MSGKHFPPPTISHARPGLVRPTTYMGDDRLYLTTSRQATWNRFTPAREWEFLAHSGPGVRHRRPETQDRFVLTPGYGWHTVNL